MCDNCGRSMAGTGTGTGISSAAATINSGIPSRDKDDKEALIKEQHDHILQLTRELDGVISERDLLLCEVSNLRFELDMIELKRLQDDNYPQKLERPQAGTMITSSYSHEQTYIQAQSYIQGQNYLAPTYSQGQTCTRSSSNTSFTSILPSYNQQQSLHKKGSLRNGDVLKRNRIQTMYELSQDLLDKQIEVLERKYGGVKARNAALTIQRAFRRYTLLKKFAAITAIAKAEKRVSRKLPNSSETEGKKIATNGGDTDGDQCGNSRKTFESSQECSMPINTPVRSLSLRERRNVNNMLLPRSQSGTNNICWNGYISYQNTPHIPQHCYSANNNSSNSYQVQTSSSSQNNDNDKHDSAYSSGSQSSSLLWTRSDSSSNNSTIGYIRTRQLIAKKVPPEVPKRTSSISSKSIEPRLHKPNGLNKTTENGSLCSVQSSGSDSSISTDKLICDGLERYSSSPLWKRQGHMSDYSEVTPETSFGNISHSSDSAYTLDQPLTNSASYKISETVRKRQYRVGLNLFNKKPERGIYYLIRRGFLENSPQGVARFLISRKGLSKQMIGEYLGNLQSSFSMAVLECFAHELDLSGMQIDVALRKFQAYFRMPGEAQKIERLMEVFSHRYCQCNLDIVARLRSPDTVFVLAFAIIMLNTDLHTPNLKPERRMRVEDFIKNLRGIDNCGDIDSDMLTGIYDRIKSNEFKPGSDHVTQVMKVQATIVGKKPNLALPHRRLVCYCRLYEIPDVNKKERPGVHQREVFLFNDLLVITKILSKKKSSVTYTFRNSFSLCGIVVNVFETPYYPYGIRLSQKVDDKLLIVFNARNEHDRYKFAEDLRESISEMDEMENLRIEAELERQKSNRTNRPSSENRDSGVADVEVCPCPCGQNISLMSSEETAIEETIHDTQFKRPALSNSLLDIHDQFAGDKVQRRGSVGSLDSGMSVSFQSPVSTANCAGRNEKLMTMFVAGTKNKHLTYQQSFLGGLFNKRERNNSTTVITATTTASTAMMARPDEVRVIVKSTEV